jgi:poly(3-hydroxybutyrate) depolymerase
MKRELYLLLLSFHLASPAAAGADDTHHQSIDSDGITISGISAGAAMAQQLHLAYPDLFSGAGLVAPLPRGCAEGNVMTALGRCTKGPAEALPVDQFVAAIRKDAEAGLVGDTTLLSGDRAWLFRGQKDAAIAESVSEAALAIYAAFLNPEDIQFVNDVATAHLFPTLDQGIDCDSQVTPYIGACGYDAAGELLQFLYPGLETPTAEAEGSLEEITLPGAAEAGLAETAFLYRPTSCPESGCRLHLALHGCAQSESQVGRAFMEQAGYLRWAAANGIVLAFPQVVASPLNPLACWDWWGYTGASYLDRDAVQMKALADWIRDLAK